MTDRGGSVANVRKGKIDAQKRRLRDSLWPDVGADELWDRKTSVGWLTVPRAMPLLLRAMDALAPKGKPVAATYLDLWCRTYDNSFVIASKPFEMAFCSGFSNERGRHTWTARIRQLEALGFILTKPGSSGPVNYVLLKNPFHVIRRHIDEENLPQEIANALLERMAEVGATDLDHE